MAKTNIRGLGKWLDGVRDAISHFDDDFYKELGDYVVERIVQKARTGKTMYRGEDAKFPALSQKYVDQRRRLVEGEKHRAQGELRKTMKGLTADDFLPGRFGREMAAKYARATTKEYDSEFFSPKRSNITLTGQYLRSIKLTKIDKKTRTLLIEPTGSRRGERITNKELAKHLAEMKRNIFGLDKTGRKVLTQKVMRKIRTQIKANLKR